MSETPADVKLGSGAMFDRIAPKYDLLNALFSFGLDARWRRRAVAALEVEAAAAARPDGALVLDLATGTADVAIAIARAHPSATVVGLDPSREMLARGQQKLEDAGVSHRVQLVEGDAQALPFDDASFDAVSIAFGIRNVPDRPAALREMARVTRPGGRVVILELGEPTTPVIAPIARWFIHSVVPAVGDAVTGTHDYAYLQASIAAFPPRRELVEIMRAAGLDVLDARPLDIGVTNLFVATPSRRS